jgi:FAD/FMN-containing dehydrogenase
MFAPDPASGDFCRLGGMLANNASGPQTIKYGTTKDHVKELKVYLPNGKNITAKKYKVKSKEFKDAARSSRTRSRTTKC